MRGAYKTCARLLTLARKKALLKCTMLKMTCASSRGDKIQCLRAIRYNVSADCGYDYHGYVTATRGAKFWWKLVTAFWQRILWSRGHRHAKLQRGLIDERLNAWETLMQYASERVGILSFTTLLNYVLGFFFNFFLFY